MNKDKSIDIDAIHYKTGTVNKTPRLTIKGFPKDMSFELSQEIQDHLKDGGNILIRVSGDGTTFIVIKSEF